MTKSEFTPTELQQAEALEQYLVSLGQGKLQPDTEIDLSTQHLVRKLSTVTVSPRRLSFPSKKKISWLWFVPLPITAVAGVITLFVFTTTNQTSQGGSQIDLTDSLAEIDQTTNDLLALETELNASLSEIDALTTTDYLDQL